MRAKRICIIDRSTRLTPYGHIEAAIQAGFEGLVDGLTIEVTHHDIEDRVTDLGGIHYEIVGLGICLRQFVTTSVKKAISREIHTICEHFEPIREMRAYNLDTDGHMDCPDYEQISEPTIHLSMAVADLVADWVRGEAIDRIGTILEYIERQV